MQNNHLYTIPRLLDKPRTFLGFPATETFPAITVFILSLLQHHEMIGFTVAVPCWYVMRRIHQAYGDNILTVMLYTYLPAPLSRISFFHFTPPACLKYWRH